MVCKAQKPIVYGWGDLGKPDYGVIIDTDSILAIADWANHFSGNHRLSQDVGTALERCNIGLYQIGYLYDYTDAKFDDNGRQQYWGEGLASIIIHIVASYEMTGRQFHDSDIVYNLVNYSWSNLQNSNYAVNISQETSLSESAFKYLRWMIYEHMGRTKRWDEMDFKKQITGIILSCCGLAHDHKIDMSLGFASCMAKLQDSEIKRH